MIGGVTLSQWGGIVRMARRAAMLASEDQRRLGRIKEHEESSIMLYTDDPTAAAIFAGCDDLPAICKTSAIEGISIVMGENFPPSAHEAEREDDDFPRVAAMWFPPIGSKCARCRTFRAPTVNCLCSTCDQMIEAMKACS